MKQYTACEHCDYLLNAPVLSHNECAFCPRCGHRVSHRPKYSLQFTLSFSIASIFLFILSNTFPFLSIGVQGQQNEMLLWQASFEFWNHGQELLAVLVFFVVLLLPFLLLIGLVYILWPMIFMRSLPIGTCWIARYIFKLKSWSMVDVYLVAVLASLTKLASMANIEFGIGLWGYISFSICLSSALANLDRRRFWQYLEKVRCHERLKQQNQPT
ncbi:paraquat-inducible protein A [Catenovulum sp. 2E275]|uniref:paraquat-inducible protein A n=1 Tax=Catenovulum sp. 2E275 TaxID=2980497 RepID=UPI0021D00071|nr:paraquat-inducible protein A [Catenovulum sp. 2E275]MCU4676013.1 paraquat-inducible protein A [Catenovulum sp. 2E275]